LSTDGDSGRIWLEQTFHGPLNHMVRKLATFGKADQATAMLSIADGFHLDGPEITHLVEETGD
jgi:hypothetical protein